MALIVRPIRIKVLNVTQNRRREDQKEVTDMTETPRAIVSDIINTHKAGKPLSDATGVCLGEPYRPVAVKPPEEYRDCFYDGNTFLDDLSQASRIELFLFVTASILLLGAVATLALVVGVVRKIKRFVTGK